MGISKLNSCLFVFIFLSLTILILTYLFFLHCIKLALTFSYYYKIWNSLHYPALPEHFTSKDKSFINRQSCCTWHLFIFRGMDGSFSMKQNKNICMVCHHIFHGDLITPSAAAAKSLQSCLTLCNPVDSSPPGSPVPGILQSRTLEWVAISFSNVWKWKVKVKSLSHVQLLVTSRTAAYQAPPPWDFTGKSTGVGCHCLFWITPRNALLFYISSHQECII